MVDIDCESADGEDVDPQMELSGRKSRAWSRIE